MIGEEEDQGKPVEEGAPAWMATFGDLMSLLLTFFVLLMSFASMDVRRFAAVVGSMRDAFGVQKLHPGQIESLADSLVKLSDRESTPFVRVMDLPARQVEREQSLLDRLRRMIEKRELQRVVEVERSPRGVVLRMPDQLLFPSGGTELSGDALLLLHEVANLVRQLPGDVSVEGHSDITPSSGSGGDNWRLSSERALAALRFLVEVEGLDASRLRATAFGSTRPLTSSPSPADQARNRRVEFVFLRSAIEIEEGLLPGAGGRSEGASLADAQQRGVEEQ